MDFETNDEFLHSFLNGLIYGYASVTTAVAVGYTFYSYFAPCTQLKKHIIIGNKAKELSKDICFIIRSKTQIVAYQINVMLSLLFGKEAKQIALLMKRLTSTMRFEELGVATDLFTIDNAIGMGKMGIMYEGRFPNNNWYVAIKRLRDSHLFRRQFLLETIILSKVRHRNIVPLLGFCIEKNERILTYPYMSNGRLSKWLHPLESEVVRLEWPEKVKIALGVARGLSWLHHSCNLRIVHFNLGSECILLDENFEPKISNFGEAKFMNPEIEDGLGMMFNVNDGKKDVYDFGSVLFEMITGTTFSELSFSDTNTSLCNGNANLSILYGAIDKSLIGKDFENEICTLIEVACQCVHPLPDRRPTMFEVYNNMSNLWEGRYGIGDDFDIVSDTCI